MLAVRLKRTAGRSAPFVDKHRAALGQPCLLFVVRRHRLADGLEKITDAVKRGLMQRHFLAEHRCQCFLGQIVQRRPEAARGDDDIRAVARGLHHMAQARRIIADNRLIKNIDAQLAQPLRDELRIRIDNVTQQNFRADGDQFCVHNGIPPSGLIAWLRWQPSPSGRQPPSLSACAAGRLCENRHMPLRAQRAAFPFSIKPQLCRGLIPRPALRQRDRLWLQRRGGYRKKFLRNFFRI